MCEKWMPPLELRLGHSKFLQLPRNPAFVYRYRDGIVHVSARPRFYHARLDLTSLVLERPAFVRIRPLAPDDWEALEVVFAEAFTRHLPFSGLTPDQRLVAARHCLTQTRTDGDGPLVADASFVAVTPTGQVLGAILLTLLPLIDPTDWDAYLWLEPPPPDCISKRLGRPHLTWIFVHPEHAGLGIGTALLQRATENLRVMGFDELLSTFIVGNDSSVLWHWRTGFRLLGYPGSPRRESLFG